MRPYEGYQLRGALSKKGPLAWDWFGACDNEARFAQGHQGGCAILKERSVVQNLRAPCLGPAPELASTKGQLEVRA